MRSISSSMLLRRDNHRRRADAASSNLVDQRERRSPAVRAPPSRVGPRGQTVVWLDQVPAGQHHPIPRPVRGGGAVRVVGVVEHQLHQAVDQDGPCDEDVDVPAVGRRAVDEVADPKLRGRHGRERGIG
ncbi:hypothetical protein [Pseudonocardia hydrocarbonoxydans]|uniref:hypothetical protein n=1 Tax=Pseudonocardia hydrocarbonoxydans TaxID=76726 RepID=UPI0031E0326C